eukprot:gb/GECG01006058.1/.p1 GENE.gb/GECG01006058.1/~~gb/GECG01006058.1/.p1  ORF type:complete len:100 (+),score=11.78 gb/GECG01006058.1/:1-300(+)
MHSAGLQNFVDGFDSVTRVGSEACVAANASVANELVMGNAPFKAGQTISFPTKLFGNNWQPRRLYIWQAYISVAERIFRSYGGVEAAEGNTLVRKLKKL